MTVQQRATLDAALRYVTGQYSDDDRVRVALHVRYGGGEGMAAGAQRLIADAIERRGFFAEPATKVMENGERRSAFNEPTVQGVSARSQYADRVADEIIFSAKPTHLFYSRPVDKDGKPKGDWEPGNPFEALMHRYFPTRRTSEKAEADRLLGELHDACRDASRRGVTCGMAYYRDGGVECFINRGRLHEPEMLRADEPDPLGWMRRQIARVRTAQQVTV